MSVLPRFITLEGIDGAGKSTHMDWLTEALRQRGVNVVVTREPGGTTLGEQWRNQLLHETMTRETQMLLMFAARSEHLAQVIRPALARGDWVLCDRFTDATYAYQGGGHGVSTDTITHLAHWLHSDCMPDLTLLFDVPLEVSQERLQAGGRALDRFECEPDGFMQRVRDAYLELARQAPQRYRVIDGRNSIDAIRDELRGVLDALFESQQPHPHPNPPLEGEGFVS
ncbi:MAG: dTMP kinase [Burkholderiales bacterium]|nr:dTMP kinase [Burkholderiales bacterium]